MPTYQFTIQMPLTYQSFVRKMHTKARNFFPQADPDDLRGSYELYKNTHFNQITMPHSFNVNYKKKKNLWVEHLVRRGLEEKRKKKNKSKDVCFKFLLFISGNKVIPSTYHIKKNKSHRIFKHQASSVATFVVDKNDIQKKKEYIKTACIILPKVPRYLRPKNIMPQQELSIRNIFEDGIYSL